MNKLKKGDEVIVIAGKDKGKRGTIKSIVNGGEKFIVEGINVVKKHIKANPNAGKAGEQGGIIDKHVAIDASKVAILQTGKKDATSRIGYTTKKDGSKVRVFKTTNKEIDV